MPNCAVKGCKSRSESCNIQNQGISFHRFPKDVVERDLWIKTTCRPNWIPKRTSCICSLHFDPDLYENHRSKRILQKHAVPTLFLNNVSTNIERKKRVPLKEVEVPVPSSSIATVCTLRKENENVPPNNAMEPIPSSSQVNVQNSTKECIEMSPRKRKLHAKIKTQAKKIKMLQTKVRNLKKKIASSEDIIKNLFEKSLISEQQKDVLQNLGVKSAEIIKREIQNNERGNITRQPFSAELRTFALTLHYYSPKAYLYVRKTFGTCLPHPRTIAKWYSNIDGRPGFTQEALNALKLLKSSDTSKKLYCTLVIDEMKIKHSPNWHIQSQRHFGHVDLGPDEEDISSADATDALVFLLVGINTTWKLPIGYFLIKGASAQLRARLVTKALQLVNDSGADIKALTCDGTKTNISMAEELGCNFDIQNLTTSFVDYSTGQNVHFFLDPCHMLKLVRNTLEYYKYFYYSGNKIDWNHVMNLHKLQEEELFFLANKLRSNHIYFKSKIMNVRLAAQLFSESVATALKFCETQLKLPGFQGASATAEFLKVINDIFDILDSKTCGFGFKKAMSLKNYVGCFDRLDHCETVLKNLIVETKNKNNLIETVNVLHSGRKTGFLGFIVAIHSAKSLFGDLIFNPNTGMSFLPLHKISQDHIEILFSNIRSHGGFSDNPTAQQFESIYKKLLIHKELTAIEKGTNCIPLMNVSILNCSSAIDKINITSESARDTGGDGDAAPESFETDAEELDLESQLYLSPFGEKVVEYIAGFVVYALAKKIKCGLCVEGLFGPFNENSLTFCKSKGYLKYASEEVIQLCRQCEKEIRLGLDENKKVHPKLTTNYVISKSLPNFIGKNIFQNIQDHNIEEFINHKIELCKAVMKKYTDTRLAYLSKKTNPQKCIRHVYSKLIHFKNQ